MTSRDFWRKSTVVVMGGGNWGSVLANLVAENCAEVRIWVRDEDQARQINSTRFSHYVPEMRLHDRIRAVSDPDRAFEGDVHAVIWALPSKISRQIAKEFAHRFKGHELVLHATKGIETGSLKRISVILAEELPLRRIGVISGPNLAHEIARGQPAATVVASEFLEVIEAGQELLNTEGFRVYGGKDVIGVEWAGTLKNVLAIAAGCLDALGLGWNTRSLLISRGLAEMVRFGTAMGAKEATFLGLAGVGDLLATCSSSLSRNYRVGHGLAEGKKLEEVLESLGSTAEGVLTAQSVWEFARGREIRMPITEGVYQVLFEGLDVDRVLQGMMARPPSHDFSG